MIKYGRQSIDQSDVNAVVETLYGDWLTQGPSVEVFENTVAEYVQARYAVAFSNGTAALHAAAAAAKIGQGDLVYTSPLTFMASANAARFVGALPRLVDIDLSTLNIDLVRVPEDARALIPVHFAGLPVDLRKATRPWRVVIEDAAHALGAITPDGPVGNCANSDMTCFSFHPVKPITTGEGGMVTTNNPEFADFLRRFRSHGIVRKPEKGAWFYEISELGYNYRMTDVQAALGTSQMRKIESFIERRNNIADRYRDLLSETSIELPAQAEQGFRHGYHLFVIKVGDRQRVFDGLQNAGIGVQVHYVPVHHHPISRDIELPQGGLPNCDMVYEQILSLPIHPELTESEQNRVVEELKKLV